MTTRLSFHSLLRSTAGKLAVLLLASSTLPAQAADFPVGSDLVSLARPCLRLRFGPKASAPVVRCLDHGRLMTLLASEGNWGRVRLSDGDEGWVLLKLVKPDDSVAGELAESTQATRGDLERRLAGARAALAAATVEAQNEGNALQIAQSENAEFQRQLTDARAALAAAQAEARNDREALREALEAAQAQNAESGRQLADSQAALAEARAEARADREALEAAQAQNAESDRRLAEAQAALAEARAEAQSERNTLEAVQASYAETDRQLAEAQAALAEARAEARADREALPKALEAAQAQNAESGRQLANAQAALAAARAEAQSERNTLEAVQASYVESDRRLAEAQAALAAAQAEARADREALPEALPETPEAAQAQNAESDRQLADLEALEAAQAANTELEQTVAIFETAAEGDAARIADLTDRLRAAEIFFEESAAQRLELTGQLAVLERENEELRQLAFEPKAAAAPIEEEPVPPRADELWALVEDWARAWSEQRIDDYLAFYASNFEPVGGLSRRQWESERRARLSRPGINVDVALLEGRLEIPERPEVEFVQSYSSDSFEDVVVKTLVFEQEEGAWKISSERVK